MNQRVDFIIPECYIDTNLVETLACHSGCNHQKGCNQVAKVMQEKYADRFAVGIIDADKRRPGYLNEFSEICSSTHIKLLRHSVRCHYIILIYPAADGFILSCAKTAEINLTDYNLSPILKEFTAQTKNVMSNKDFRFKRLFKSMEDMGEMKLMQELLIYLVNNPYRVSNVHLISIFESYQ
ncbi:MAG: hypothetical protein K2L17_06820 [Muribaculaceae bacterium]|nr:hypothetical protein [Muribaculaceae bacterium]